MKNIISVIAIIFAMTIAAPAISQQNDRRPQERIPPRIQRPDNNFRFYYGPVIPPVPYYYGPYYPPYYYRPLPQRPPEFYYDGRFFRFGFQF